MDVVHTVVEALAARGLDVRKCRMRPLRRLGAPPNHCYSLTCFDHGRGTFVRKIIIGKCCAGRDGARTFEILRELWQRGFERDPWLTIPEPIAYVPALELLLQERAGGKALHGDVEDPARSNEKARRTARWLAKLHATRLTRAPTLPPSYEEERLSRYGRALGRLFPGLACRIERIAGRVASSLAALGAHPLVPTHGDFQPRNIHVSGDRITVFDFDRCAMAHPARDLGHFIGQCMTMSYVRAASFREIEPWNAAFLDEYGRHASLQADPALSAFVARTFLEVLHHKLFVFPVADPSFLPVWLGECERWAERC